MISGLHHSSRPTYVCLPSGLYHARSGRILQQSGPNQEVTPLPGIYFFDGWRVRPCMKIPTNLPRAQDPPEHDTQPFSTTAHTAEQPQTPDEEARDILAKAIRNQAEDGPSTRRAAIRAYKYLHAMVRQHGPQLRLGGALVSALCCVASQAHRLRYGFFVILFCLVDVCHTHLMGDTMLSSSQYDSIPVN